MTIWREKVGAIHQGRSFSLGRGRGLKILVFFGSLRWMLSVILPFSLKLKKNFPCTGELKRCKSLEYFAAWSMCTHVLGDLTCYQMKMSFRISYWKRKILYGLFHFYSVAKILCSKFWLTLAMLSWCNGFQISFRVSYVLKANSRFMFERKDSCFFIFVPIFPSISAKESYHIERK